MCCPITFHSKWAESCNFSALCTKYFMNTKQFFRYFEESQGVTEDFKGSANMNLQKFSTAQCVQSGRQLSGVFDPRTSSYLEHCKISTWTSTFLPLRTFLEKNDLLSKSFKHHIWRSVKISNEQVQFKWRWMSLPTRRETKLKLKKRSPRL